MFELKHTLIGLSTPGYLSFVENETVQNISTVVWRVAFLVDCMSEVRIINVTGKIKILVYCQSLIMTMVNAVKWCKICTDPQSWANRLLAHQIGVKAVSCFMFFISIIMSLRAVLIIKVERKILLHHTAQISFMKIF